jgi:cobaltochelatase CobS
MATLNEHIAEIAASKKEKNNLNLNGVWVTPDDLNLVTEEMRHNDFQLATEYVKLYGQVEQLDKHVQQLEREKPVKVIVVKDNKPPLTLSGYQHAAFEPILRRVQSGCNVLIVGPTQSGKTHLAIQVAKALSLPFTANSLSAGTRESDLFGWLLPTKAGGTFEYHAAPLVNLALKGGLWLADEIDAADNNLLLSLNTLLANRKLYIPHRLEGQSIEVHPDFRCIAAANTWGTGADSQYVGRTQLDAATLARFVKVEVDYDPLLEQSLFTQEICTIGHTIRANIRKHRLQRVLSTTHLSNWTKCLSTGISLGECLSDYFLGWTPEEKKMATQLKPGNTEHPSSSDTQSLAPFFR